MNKESIRSTTLKMQAEFIRLAGLLKTLDAQLPTPDAKLTHRVI